MVAEGSGPTVVCLNFLASVRLQVVESPDWLLLFSDGLSDSGHCATRFILLIYDEMQILNIQHEADWRRRSGRWINRGN